MGIAFAAGKRAAIFGLDLIFRSGSLQLQLPQCFCVCVRGSAPLSDLLLIYVYNFGVFLVCAGVLDRFSAPI